MALAQGGPDLQFVAVLGRAAESYPQGAGGRGLGHPGIRAGVPTGVAGPCCERAGSGTADRGGAQRSQHAGNPGRYIVDNIV